MLGTRKTAAAVRTAVAGGLLMVAGVALGGCRYSSVHLGYGRDHGTFWRHSYGGHYGHHGSWRHHGGYSHHGRRASHCW